MNNILITQVVSFSKKKGFSLTLSKDWYEYAKKININLIPYDYIFSKNRLDQLNFKGVIFSGGNDLYKLNKKKENAMRDRNEIRLLKYVIARKKPILGVCRGFQLISNYFNTPLIRKPNHVRVNHTLYLKNSKFIKAKALRVNSYHNYCIENLSKKFNVVSRHLDNTIEIAENIKKNILCLMFHPERKNFSQISINKYIKFFFKIK